MELTPIEASATPLAFFVVVGVAVGFIYLLMDGMFQAPYPPQDEGRQQHDDEHVPDESRSYLGEDVSRITKNLPELDPDALLMTVHQSNPPSAANLSCASTTKGSAQRRVCRTSDIACSCKRTTYRHRPSRQQTSDATNDEALRQCWIVRLGQASTTPDERSSPAL
jgi:hypothetical protein